MAHWQDAAVTNDGVEMLNEWMAGRSIKVVSAYGGTGTVSVDELMEQTGLVDQRQRLNLAGEENSAALPVFSLSYVSFQSLKICVVLPQVGYCHNDTPAMW